VISKYHFETITLKDMKTVDDLKDEINAFSNLISNGWFTTKTFDSKRIWEKIREINALFKEIRFPSKEDRQIQWSLFQDLISKVKHIEQEERELWNRKKFNSEELLNRIKSLAYNAEPPNPLNDVIVAVFTGGLSSVISDIMGQFDEHKSDLLTCSKNLKEGWNLFSQSKSDLLSKDKREAYNALSQAQERLDLAWSAYKEERQIAFEKHQRIKMQRNEQRIDKIESNIENLKQRKERLLEVLDHKESHLSELRDKYYEAKSDGYRDRVSEWIDEEERNIRELEEKINNIDNWIDEQRAKL